nr:MAG TPA: Loader and inhibitor of phage G40P [Caudoviricetes sp.]
MNPTEATQVLAKAAAYDNRQPDQAAALAWAEALDRDMPLQDALRIVGEHYRDERAWVMPADINRRWRALGKARLETAQRMGLPEPPDELADSPGDWAAWKKAQIAAVKAGCDGTQAEARAWHAIGRTPLQRREVPSAPPPADWQAMLNAATPRQAPGTGR